jgi:hypothetical protein
MVLVQLAQLYRALDSGIRSRLVGEVEQVQHQVQHVPETVRAINSSIRTTRSTGNSKSNNKAKPDSNHVRFRRNSGATTTLGTPEDNDSDLESQNDDNENDSHKNTRRSQNLVFLALGVVIAFTISGSCLETVTRTAWGAQEGTDGERFSFPILLILIQSCTNVMISGSLLLYTHDGPGHPNWSAGAPAKEWLVVSSAYLGAHFCTLKVRSLSL